MSSKVYENGSLQAVALADLITAQVQFIVTAYSTLGQTLPSLDSTAAGPFDVPANTPVKISTAVQLIEAACAQLCATVANPGHSVIKKTNNYVEPACMLVVVNAKIADLLLGKPEGEHIEALAKQTHLDAGKLGRILRLLATNHCFIEVKPNVFANSRLSLKLVSSDPTSSLVGLLTDEGLKSCAYMNETLFDPKSGPSMLPEDAAFKRAHGSPIFEFHEKAEEKHRAERFAEAMIGWAAVTDGNDLSKVYPWDKLPQNTTICDVGGNTGHATLPLIKAYPKLQIVLQDLPTVIEQAKEFWRKENPKAVDNQSIRFVPVDFFKGSLAHGCDYYYIRHVLHNWAESECIKLLTNVRKAMIPSSKLLIHDIVLQPPVRNTTSVVDQAPEPLLPNYGVGRVLLYQQDINMMGLVNSKERTLEEFIDLGSQAGFEFVKTWDAGEANSLLEFRPL
ncbi:3-O-methyltransferase 2 [Hypsizygus marmoreus]|uniref:3-O-methyltransferase 2 n=1 Tax=Hypsizygus marmoreus TaxID=39966 RepID=A0A369JCB1_HYPMA|nr:3-O-methyltransferase 2 [Hypsizygus marmoreus]